ncbi:MAG: protein kinase domain-containing protein [Kofleriaceae bacterium]
MVEQRNDESSAGSSPPDRDEPTPFSTGDKLLQAVFAGPPPVQTPLVKGQRVAEVYEIVERIGAGGMGVVYLARDPRLARNVALKLIRTPSSTSVARLVREAQAIAQLTHPNVVTVYEIGTHDGQPFVAMEYVDGGTARTWLASKPRTWREIVALYVAAGRGLEAAHRAQLVHRDFKPDNVLVGDDGRVRVADFGVVQSETWPTTEGDDTSASSETMTKTGTVMGTPAYMAPEQRHGNAVDKAADQFAFAVALWEALTGARPVATDRANVGAPKRPIPQHVEVALRRALSSEPAARWPGMAPLLEELARDPNARRRRVAWVAGGLVVTAAIVAPLALRAAQAEPCTDGPAVIATSWSDEQRAAMVAALGPRVGATVRDALDRYANEWAAAHRQACRDTRVTGSQSEDMLDRRMQCLFSARAALDATVDLLHTASPEGKARATDAVARLPGLDQCTDLQALARQDPLPTDPDVRQRLDEASRQLIDVHLAELAPKRIDRMERADAALARAREVGWRPLLARALLIHSQQLRLFYRNKEAMAELREAITLTIIGNLPNHTATAFADLAVLLGESEQHEAADLALLAARAYEERAGPGRMQSILLAGSLVASRAHDHDKAIALARELVELVESNPHNDYQTPMTSRHQLAGVLASAGRTDEAVAVIDKAISWGETQYGADDAEVGMYRALRATYLMKLGRLDETIDGAKAALAILEKSYAPDSVRLADVLLTLGDAYSRAGQLEPVMPYLDRALAAARNGEDAKTIASIETQRVIYFMHTGDLTKAAPAADSLVAAADKSGNLYARLNALLVRGVLRRDLQQYADSERDLVRALEIGKVSGENAAIQNLRVELGRTWIALGRAADARDMLARQVPLLPTTADIDPMLLVETQVVLASALHAGGDKIRARASITEADRIRKAHPDRPELGGLIDEWHAKHP